MENPNQTGKSGYSLDVLQRVALGGMFILVLLTFVGANFHAYLWQSSNWLVSTVLPSVVVSLTNDERSDVSAAPLRRNATLDAAAKLKAEHMAKNEYFSHYAPDGTSPWYWFDKAGYVYAHAGENLAIHFTDSGEVVDAWMNSPTHRANIVNNAFTEIGVGTAKGSFDGHSTVYVVQLFGTPAKPAAAPKPAPAPAPVAVEAIAVAPTAPAVEVEENSDVLAATDPAPAPATTTPEEIASTTDTDVMPSDEASTTPIATTDTPRSNQVLPPVIPESTIATSSGLAAFSETATTSEPAPVAGVVTRPNALLQIVYTLFGFIVIGLLLAAAVTEARHNRFVQVAYSFGLLLVMGGLWYVHAILTTGTVIL
jgi:hypothetical protein